MLRSLHPVLRGEERGEGGGGVNGGGAAVLIVASWEYQTGVKEEPFRCTKLSIHGPYVSCGERFRTTYFLHLGVLAGRYLPHYTYSVSQKFD